MSVTKALKNLRPGAAFSVLNEEYDGITWYSTDIDMPTREEVERESTIIQQYAPFAICKEKARQKIALTDWAVLPDVGLANISEYQEYRATLRELIKNPVANPDWPTEPSPVWE